jgi:cell division protein FtsI (penicillin-binding protein 3)
VAAPVFSSVVADALRLMNIAPDDVEPEAEGEDRGDAAA